MNPWQSVYVHHGVFQRAKAAPKTGATNSARHHYCCRSPLSVEKRAVIKKILVIINEKVGKRAKRTKRAREKSAENERVQHHTPENGKKGSIQPPRTQKRAASNP